MNGKRCLGPLIFVHINSDARKNESKNAKYNSEYKPSKEIAEPPRKSYEHELDWRAFYEYPT